MIRLYYAALLTAAMTVATSAEHHIIGLTSDSDSWTTTDKREHFACGMAIGAIGTFLADEIAPDAPRWKKVCVGIAASVLAGAIKEVSDYRHPCTHDCSLKDFAATAAGGIVGSVSVSVVFRF